MCRLTDTVTLLFYGFKPDEFPHMKCFFFKSSYQRVLYLLFSEKVVLPYLQYELKN